MQSVVLSASIFISLTIQTIISFMLLNSKQMLLFWEEQLHCLDSIFNLLHAFFHLILLKSNSVNYLQEDGSDSSYLLLSGVDDSASEKLIPSSVNLIGMNVIGA